MARGEGRADASGLPAIIPRVAVPKLSAEQERTIRDVVAEADAFGASPMERLAAIQTIGVEANYGNPNYGDRDSLGPFQQRASWGSATDRRNPRKAARKFFETARQMRQAKKYTRAGDLAADVQRPQENYRGRYQARRGEALAILQQYGGGGGATSGGSSAGGLAGALQGPANDFDAARGSVSPLEIPTGPTLAAVPVSGPAAPAVGGQPTMPAGYGGAPMAGAPQAPAPVELETPDYGDALGQQQAEVGGGGSDSSTSDEAASAGGGKPRVRVAAGANAAGKPIARSLLKVLDEISVAGDREIVVTTGTNHSVRTTTGSVSEHTTGHGADVAATGKALTDGATDALLTVARGKTVQWLRNDGKVLNVRLTAANTRKLVQAGGIFNVPHGDGGRIQVIANTHQGGDHTNHWHVGLREGE